METFWRLVDFARPYRWRMIVSLLCGLVVAALWGANITALYPVLTVLLQNKTAVGWADERIAGELEKSAKLAKEQADRETSLREIAQGNPQLLALLDQEADGRVRFAELNWWQSANPLSAERSALRDRDRQFAQLSPGDSELTRLIKLQRRDENRLAWSKWSADRYQAARPWLVRFTPNDSFRTLCLLFGMLMAGLVVKGVFDFLQVYLAGGVIHLAIFDLRNEFYRKTMALDLSNFSEKGTHDLMARFTSDVEALSGGLRSLFNKVILEPINAVSCLTFACVFINWRLTVVSLLMFPSAALVMWQIGRYLKRVSRRNLESMSRIYKILQESFLGIRIVKAFTMERYERHRFYEETKKYFHQSMKLVRADALGAPLLEVIAVTAVCGTLVLGGYLVLTGETEIWGIKLTDNPLRPETLFALYGLILGVCDPLRKVFSVFGRVQRGMAAAERIFQCIDRPARVIQKPKAPNLPRHHRHVEFDDVAFEYLDNRPVLHNIRLRVEFGETIAMVGATGCGKTSLINLLPRFYDPTHGAVRIDGTDLRDVSIRSLRQQMGIVTQHTILFDDTIFNNIAYGNPSVEAAEVEEAAKAAYAHKFIEELPDGYQTRIGEMGASLSGGQRQRIALARAILRDPAILILDEATSSLDVESEALIHKALRKFIRGRTTFVVTHRLSTLDIADRIVVIDNGRIEAVGTHKELLIGSQTYGRLHNVQALRA